MPTSAASERGDLGRGRDAAARELEELQLERLRETVAACCAPTGSACAAGEAGRCAVGHRLAERARRIPFTIKSDLREPVPVRAAGRARAISSSRLHASSGTHGKPTVVGYTRGRPRHVDRADGALHDDGRRPARDADPQRQQLWAVHRRPRVPSGRRADRRDGAAGVGRLHGAAGDAARTTSARRCSSRRRPTRS